MTKLSDLTDDLVGEILSRVTLTSLIAVRSTCKLWNALSKKLILGKRAESRKQQFLEFIKISSRVCSMKFDRKGIRNEEEEFIDPSTKQVSVFDGIRVSQIFCCDGLLLCVPMEEDDSITRVIVWNPYLGQIRWIEPRTKFGRYDGFALGFDNNGNHKILRSVYERGICIDDVYDFSTDSWRVLDISPDSKELCFSNGVSLKGNAYLFDEELTTVETEEADTVEVDYLVCFDFTTERFGPRLSLPFHPPYPSIETLTLSSVRDEKLSVLYQHGNTFDIVEIWVTTKIEPNVVSWSKFLRVDMSLINGLPDDFKARCFFSDEEKKVAVVFNGDPYRKTKTIACIIGEDGYFKSVNGEEAANPWDYGPHVCSSYVPSLVQL
ncbi:hypothetical protein AALP_AA5G092400 [Arabis alpina]|uniref:F-box domain-containing protein n=1 Tax=Arabis alpina TaxID=50452 RepID=A0A087GVX5_ARAAL|nr:hypothetical protein AALP_AA5G092400 [Arabis alpina]